jgi:hypothetical protein
MATHFGLHYLPTLIERMRSARHELHAGTSRQAGILRYTEVRMVGWGVSPEFNLLKMAGKQRASQKNQKSVQTSWCFLSTGQHIVDLGIKK